MPIWNIEPKKLKQNVIYECHTGLMISVPIIVSDYSSAQPQAFMYNCDLRCNMNKIANRYKI